MYMQQTFEGTTDYGKWKQRGYWSCCIGVDARHRAIGVHYETARVQQHTLHISVECVRKNTITKALKIEVVPRFVVRNRDVPHKAHGDVLEDDELINFGNDSPSIVNTDKHAVRVPVSAHTEEDHNTVGIL
jgi:aromatic ring-opening dioxygenase LigB subunit